MDSDRILVMENGFAKEYDIPYRLLQQPNGIFQNLVNSLDQDEKQKLIEIAKSKYEENFNIGSK